MRHALTFAAGALTATLAWHLWMTWTWEDSMRAFQEYGS